MQSGVCRVGFFSVGLPTARSMALDRLYLQARREARNPGGFRWGTPIAGWFLLKSHLEMDDIYRDTPILGTPQIFKDAKASP